MIILSIVCILLACALLALMGNIARPIRGGWRDGQTGREGSESMAAAPSRPFPYDHEMYPGSV